MQATKVWRVNVLKKTQRLFGEVKELQNMAFSVSTLKGVKVYNLTFGKTADQWKEEQRAGHIHSLRYNEGFLWYSTNHQIFDEAQ